MMQYQANSTRSVAASPRVTRASAHRVLRCAALSLTIVFAASLGRAQDKGPTIGPPAGPGGDLQKELKELFGKVENRLREIDRLLSDAGAGDTTALAKVGPSGIDELLKTSKQRGEEALKDIDRILEIAREMGQPSSSSSSSGSPQGQPQPGGGKSDGKNPLDNQDGNTTQRENTPTAPKPQGQEQPDKKPGGDKPDPSGQQPKKDSTPGNSTPKDGDKSSDKDPKNQKGGTPPGGAKDPAARTSDDKDRWGDLPQHAQDVFRSEGGRDMPVQYRDWIDAYYKRLNKKQP
jgi:hypothetical protein